MSSERTTESRAREFGSVEREKLTVSSDVVQRERKAIQAGGGTGIRTLGGVAPATVFETVPFSRSGIPPSPDIYPQKARSSSGTSG
jgi:hypothetical protein